MKKFILNEVRGLKVRKLLQLTLTLLLGLVLSSGNCTTDPVPDPFTDTGVTINGVVWATRNVDEPGKFAAKPESFGMFYLWNKKLGWSSTDPLKNSNGGTIWEPITGGGPAWATDNDPCPTGWRIPTGAELSKLANNAIVTRVWGEKNSVKGYFFAHNGNEIFLPAAGCRGGSGTLALTGADGRYWGSGTAYMTVHGLLFRESMMSDGYSGPLGLNEAWSIRCVKK